MADKPDGVYRDRRLALALARRIHATSNRPIRLMEVCGTHTSAIFRSGVRSLLPDTISLVSGPGCPVCVTAQQDIDAFIALARLKDVTITTFGDLLKVPGTASSLQKERAAGGDIRMVYSTFDAVKIARQNPNRRVVFLGVGFETTTPTIAASIVKAAKLGLGNYWVYSAHKLVPPALEALAVMPAVSIDGLILPGHVSVVIGRDGYRSFFNRHRIPCAIAGFEPVDILLAVLELVEQIETGRPTLANKYPRAVSDGGNRKARQMIASVFDIVDSAWRGMGVIPRSGLALNDDHAAFDAARHFAIRVPAAGPPTGCACGAVLTGRINPPACPLFDRGCTPMTPVGPCMVSSEGTCAAYYRFNTNPLPITTRPIRNGGMNET